MRVRQTIELLDDKLIYLYIDIGIFPYRYPLEIFFKQSHGVVYKLHRLLADCLSTRLFIQTKHICT